jgi:hypothetical protein
MSPKKELSFLRLHPQRFNDPLPLFFYDFLSLIQISDNLFLCPV